MDCRTRLKYFVIVCPILRIYSLKMNKQMIDLKVILNVPLGNFLD